MTLQEMHDQMLQVMPDGATHDAQACPMCNPNANHANDNSIGGGDMKTYTEEEFNAAVSEAVTSAKAEVEAQVTEMKTELETLKAAKAAEEVEGQIAEVKAELDKAEIRVADAERKYDELVAFLEAEAAAAEEAAAIEARRGARRDAVQATAPFTAEYIDANLDRWVAMSDEAFDAILEDWKAVSTSSRDDQETNDLPRETAMSNVRDNASTGSVSKDIFDARNKGVDVRYL